MLPTLAAGSLLWFLFRNNRYELRLRDGFLITGGIWLIASLVTAIPFYLALPQLTFTDAVFESTSGLTTTGATMLTGLDSLPKSLLFFRSSLNFFGGMGIVILAVAVLPMLKIGGMHLFKAESTGPVKDNKLTPRIAETAQYAVGGVFRPERAVRGLAYWFGGMSLFDAVSHAMTTVATAGFSTHDASFAIWNSPLMETDRHHFHAARRHQLRPALVSPGGRRTVSHYQADSELRCFLAIAAVFIVIVALYLLVAGEINGYSQSFRAAMFQVVSHITTTGYASTGFSHVARHAADPDDHARRSSAAAPAPRPAASRSRACSWSSAGPARTEAAGASEGAVPGHHGRPTRVGKRGDFGGGFCALYITVYLILVLLLWADGMDLLTAFSAAAACLNNLGPGLGQVAVHFQALSDFSTWLMSFAMLVGRLEIFTILVLFTPAFWQE